MRYTAPADVTGIHLSSGPLTVIDGFVEVPDDASPGDLGGLAVNGFYPAPTSARGRPAPAPSEPVVVPIDDAADDNATSDTLTT